MSSIAFRVLIHGLIALAPSPNPNDPNLITALLLDARMPHDTECAGEHHPTLSFLVASDNLGECVAAGCDPTGNQCVCTDSLFGKKIWLQINPRSVITSHPEAPLLQAVGQEDDDDDIRANNHGIPSEGFAPAGDLRYVANMTKPPFNARLNLDYLSHQPPSSLFARMDIPFSTLTACSLSKREDQGKTYVLPMSIRPLRSRSRDTDRSQAFAQMVLARFDIEEGQTVTLNISDFNGENEKSIALAPGDNGYVIDLSNEPDELERGDACDDGVARHFAHFYEFAENRPAWSDRLIPHVRFVEGMDAKDEERALPECFEPTFHFMDRPICPMASFLPET